ncbi:MAG: serine hydrolase [Desulfobulbus sp.]|nr:serine hydrolase [Desulfobulbus sp.]
MKTHSKIVPIVTALLCLAFFQTGECKLDYAKVYSDELTKIQKEISKELNAPGDVLYVKFPDGSVWVKAFGLAELGNIKNNSVNLNMQFRIASVTKTFIGTAILQLVKNNKFKLDDSMSVLFPGLIKYENLITVRMLLNHSSGIKDYATSDEFTEIYVNDFNKSWEFNELYKFIDKDTFQGTPGGEAYYSNTNYYLLGMIIEKFSKTSLDKYLKQEIFDKLGMNSTYFPTTNDLKGNFAHGYFDRNENGSFGEDEDVSSQNPTAIWAAGMVVSTVKDLSIWIDELFNGSLIGNDLQKERFKINTHLNGAPDFVNIGLGIAEIDQAIGHTGAIPGFTSVLFRYKGADIIALSNCFHTRSEMGSVAEKLLENVKSKVVDKIKTTKKMPDNE